MTGVWLAVGIAIAGGVGAAARHLVDSSFSPQMRARFPWGIITINLTGSFAIGIVTGLSLAHPVAAVAATGFLGGYTTFSTASLDTVQLLMKRRYGAALVNGVGVLVAAVVLAAAGILLGRALV
ncbi:fluoride efflux transporter CrcB [Leucobacter sp. NPDC058333]|uniref:fluoride efflux transporter CrcB n=1 Tax=Leucobacter sp. NPDC058333 TaxID=3346450 RepID=UPI003645F82F